METALQLVLGLLQLGAVQLHHRATVPLVPSADVPARLLSELVPATGAELAACIQTLAAEPTAPHTLVELRRIAEQITQATGTDPQRSTRLETVAQHIQTIAAINQDAVAGQHAIRQVRIDLANSPLLRYIQEWHIRPVPPESTSIILCHVSNPPGAHVVRLRGQTYIERRVALRYHAHDLHPSVELRALAATLAENMPNQRQVWKQRPLPEDDLSIYSEQERYKGRVTSRRLMLPIVIDGPPFHITLTTTKDAYVVATDIFDENDSLLVRVIRWPP